ncbi:MAG: endonuclease MutS2 [Firmicutes bacterium]|nr:endonuclease MutS2 [Bacillota bacterium]MBQ2271236.1 endonuclease MutS2 [Bacillota bacterium]MBQ5798057.1 endonuclease MutS2 [Bacillota bacterium]
MNDKARRVLEYNKIIGLLSDMASSSVTKERIGKLSPMTEAWKIREAQEETTEAVNVIMAKGALPLGGFYDINGLARVAKKGGTLNMKQLLQVLYNLQVARNAAIFLGSDLPKEQLPKIMALASVISVQKRLEDEIDRCILSEDEMADSASPELKRLRRAILRQNEDIRVKINSMINSQENKTLLQDSIVTIRQGRYVIPVKQEHKGKVSGIVHDQSQTGATLFIEPQAIVNMNNELRELELQEKKEVQRILAELSGQVGLVEREIANNQKILLELDFMFAKGKLSVKMRGSQPTINDQGYLRIKNGRHPLIDAKKVVPVTVALGRDYHTLVITGPNTGGKTVTLKTIGLFAMMAQSGLHLPADCGTEMPIYHKIFADIGDEQSIEQSLSTFSSHMTNIVSIVKESDDRTLVLLDELCAGTDPTEGAALAIAILGDLQSRGAAIAGTTHYTELKKYALSTAGVQNASMEFDVETLSPTYRLRIGVPGRSNAFEISKKLGLDDHIVERAGTLLERGDIQFEDVITKIEQDRKAAEAERDEAILLNIEMKRQKEKLEEKAQRLEEQKDKILSRAREEAADMIKEARELSDRVAKELRQMEKLRNSGEIDRRHDKIRGELREASGKYREKVKAVENDAPVNPNLLKIGDRVKVLTVDQKGNVLTLPDSKGDLQVQVGLLKLTVNLKNISKIQENGSTKEVVKQKYGALYRSKAQSVSISCNVIGKTLDEAEDIVDKYLDDAFMAGLKEVSVIHGRGAGILREGLQKMMKRHKHVASYRKGAYNEGGDGVTVVTLK